VEIGGREGGTNGKATNDAATGNRGTHDGDVVLELGLENPEVVGAAVGHQAVGVGEAGKHADLAAVFELRPHCHLLAVVLLRISFDY
jgi:hypothetical protein